MVAAALLALALAAPAPAEAAAEERVVEEVVAVVRNPPASPPRIVTWTRLVGEARIALVSRGATAAASGPLDREALRAALDWLVGQMLVADEAATLRLADVDRAEVLAELRRFQGRFPSRAEYEAFLARAQLPEDELLSSLARMVRVQRHVQSRLGASVRVGDDEVDRRLRERGAHTGSAGVREAVRAELAEERTAAQVKALLAELRARADVRILGGLRVGEAG